MAYIFMDESGDLWFDKKWSSKYFIITFLFQKHGKTSDLIIKKLFHQLKGKKVKINDEYSIAVRKIEKILLKH